MTTAQKTIWNEALWKAAETHEGLKSLRAKARSRFEALGFPNSKSEAWRYTSLAGIEKGSFQFAPQVKPDAKVFEHLRVALEPFKNYARLVFLNGWLNPQLSDIKSFGDAVDFSSVRDLVVHRPQVLPQPAENIDALNALNAALFQDGFWLQIKPGSKLTIPLLIYFLNTESNLTPTFQLRSWITLAKNAELEIVEWHDDSFGSSQGFWNQQLTVNLDQGAKLEHVRLQNATADLWLRSATEANLTTGSHYERLDLEYGGRVARNEINVNLKGKQSICNLKGAALGNGKQHFDTQVVMDHLAPSASSDQVYRNLLAGKSRGIFGGRVRVCHDAQKTDAHQVHKTLLLSKEARADTKPQLEIDADDVQCSHGAAIGQLDEDSLFYLRSRGISRANAEKMLAAGFVEKILDSISDENLRGFLLKQVKAKLSELFNFGSEPSIQPRD